MVEYWVILGWGLPFVFLPCLSTCASEMYLTIAPALIFIVQLSVVEPLHRAHYPLQNSGALTIIHEMQRIAYRNNLYPYNCRDGDKYAAPLPREDAPLIESASEDMDCRNSLRSRALNGRQPPVPVEAPGERPVIVVFK